MDVFERVREVNRGAGLNEVRIAAARARLVSGIESGMSAERKRIARRPMFLIAGAVAGVAAATAGVVVVSQMTAPAPHVEAIPTATATPKPQPTPTPEPSATSGTGVTEPFPGTTPQAGQELRIVKTEDRVYYRTGYGEVYLAPASMANPPISAALMRTYSSTNVPADRHGEWRGTFGPQTERLQIFGYDNEVVSWTWDTMVPYSPDVAEFRSTGGLEYEEYTGISGPTYYDAHPRDPQALLDYWNAFYSDEGDGRDDAVMTEIMSVLRSNLAPADVRQAYIAALQLSGRATVAGTNGAIVTYAVQYSVYDPRWETISIDSSTGWVTEYTQAYARTDGGLVPSDVPDVRVTIQTSIVAAQ